MVYRKLVNKEVNEMITITVEELKRVLDELIEDDVEYVDVTILEKDVMPDGEELPATLHFSSYNGDGGGADYDPIEEVEVDAFYRIRD